VINKFDKRGALDALRDVRKQWRRNRVAFEVGNEEIPVYPTIASQFNDPGLTWMFTNLCRAIGRLDGIDPGRWDPGEDPAQREPLGNVLIPGSRVGYLAEIAEQGREINNNVESQAALAFRAQHLLRGAARVRRPGAARGAGAARERRSGSRWHASQEPRCKPTDSATHLLQRRAGVTGRGR
jgi:methylmalonyl-CoA mutase